MADLTGGLKALGVALVLLLLGGAIAGGGWYLHQDAQQATENSIEVEATVVSTEVADERVSSDTGSHLAYYPVVEYRYTYEGREYASTKLCPGTGSGCDAAQNRDDRSDVEEFLSEYPVGETVTAHVLPEDPSQAYLVDAASASNSYFVLVGIGGVIGLLGLLGVANGIKELVVG